MFVFVTILFSVLGSFFTFISIVSDFPLELVAVIYAIPGVLAITFPVALTVATFSFISPLIIISTFLCRFYRML